MILVDSSVWIDYFNGTMTPETDKLDRLLTSEVILAGELMLAEVLQGFRTEDDFYEARKLLDAFEVRTLGGKAVALAAATHYRTLRSKGITVRKTVDMLIRAYCILHTIPLLQADRDFDAMEVHLGLQVVR